MSKRLEGRVALVTGASRGIGAAIAKRLAAEGAHIIALARTVGGLEELDDAIKSAGGSTTLVPLDLREAERIDPLGPHLHQRFGKLDIFIGNAALLGNLGPLPHQDPKLFQDVIAVNLTANWRLIRTLEPLLKLSDAGRAVFVTSGAAVDATAYWGPYSVSKAALEMLTRVWAAELERSKVRVNLFDPGAVRTSMRAHAFPGEDPMSLPTPGTAAEQIVELVLPSYGKTGTTLRAY